MLVKVTGGYLEVENLSPGVPTHPIYNPAYPDNSLPRPPGSPQHPIYNPAYPAHPIYNPAPGSPQHPIYNPAYPAHPIYNPVFPDNSLPLPPQFPNPPADGMSKPPPENGGWGYSSEYGWGYFPAPGEASPK